MNETDFREELTEAIFEHNDDMSVRPFAEAGLMTDNEGIIVRTPDGEEFQITIVRSK